MADKLDEELHDFNILRFNKVPSMKFINFWEKRYSDPREDIYEKNIDEKKTRKVINELFEWKNGGKLSKKKSESVERNYKPFDGVRKKESELKADPDFMRKMKQDSPIWRIFWLHCQNPLAFPIYDQHAHRAMKYLRGLKGEAAEIPNSNNKKIDLYFDEFRPFVEESFTKPTTWRQMRQIDKALFAFGKFVKTHWVPDQ